MVDPEKKCILCGKVFTGGEARSIFATAGEWLADEVWKDSNDLCNLCLDNRGRLAMMYLHDKNR